MSDDDIDSPEFDRNDDDLPPASWAYIYLNEILIFIVMLIIIIGIFVFKS